METLKNRSVSRRSNQELNSSTNLILEGENTHKIGQEQVHGLLFGEQVSWQAIIYDLINSEQLDPWDVDITILSNKYLERVREIEEADFFVSSKVLLAASLLLRIKSEILLNRDIPSLDDILFGREEKKTYTQERIELDEEMPDLIPRTPLARARKVSLQELMTALGKAIHTENRRIKKVVTAHQQEIETALSLPTRRFNLKDEITRVYSKLKELFSGEKEKISFNEISGKTKEERVGTFVPLLHLDNQQKVFLEQEGHFQEIWVWMKKIYEEKNAALLEIWRREAEEAMAAEELEEMEEDEGEERKIFRKESVDENYLGLKKLFGE
ncbi:segregation/condensation protein A [Candidatus Pacearchaeota archaeon]|nr:segregation/condensation protein A [Candidatus Pacearchaeota archaeon]